MPAVYSRPLVGSPSTNGHPTSQVQAEMPSRRYPTTIPRISQRITKTDCQLLRNTSITAHSPAVTRSASSSLFNVIMRAASGSSDPEGFRHSTSLPGLPNAAQVSLPMTYALFKAFLTDSRLEPAVQELGRIADSVVEYESSKRGNASEAAPRRCRASNMVPACY